MLLEENAMKKTKKSRAGRPSKPINYARVEYWARRLVLEKLLQRRLVSVREVCESE